MSFKTYVAPLRTTEIPLTGLSLGGPNPQATIIQGHPFRRKVVITPLNTYPLPLLSVTSSDAAIAIGSVDINGELTVLGLKPGSANIAVAGPAGIDARIAITVDAPPPPVLVRYQPPPAIPATGLTITAAVKTLTPLQQFDLSALVEPRNFNRGSVVWSSSDRNVAIVADTSYVENYTGVNRTGHTATIRAIAPGTASITANIGGIAATCVVTVV